VPVEKRIERLERTMCLVKQLVLHKVGLEPLNDVDLATIDSESSSALASVRRADGPANRSR
jgi:hypothetical protein